MRFRSALASVLVVVSAGHVLGDVIASEFLSEPNSEGWEMASHWCEPVTWVADGWYHQDLDDEACPGGESGASDSWTRSAEPWNGCANWFFEFRVSATGDRSEIPGGAPTVVAAGNAYGMLYHATLASDRLKLLRDVDLPIIYVDLEPGVAHRVRLTLDNVQQTYDWYVDGVWIDGGPAEGPFPADDASITWRGRSWHLPTVNAWDYVRAGDCAAPASGDFDSSSTVDGFDFSYFAECVERTTAGEPAFPSCAWADMDGDGDVDCTDWDAFRDAWTDTENDPPAFPPCYTDPIPAVSDWGLAVLALLVLTIGTLTFRRTRPSAT